MGVVGGGAALTVREEGSERRQKTGANKYISTRIVRTHTVDTPTCRTIKNFTVYAFSMTCLFRQVQSRSWLLLRVLTLTEREIIEQHSELPLHWHRDWP